MQLLVPGYGQAYPCPSLLTRLRRQPRSFRLPARQVGMVVDKGQDFPPPIHAKLLEYGSEMWLFREQQSGTTRALNSYIGDHRK
jgi:hypothetical protein